MDRNVTAAAIRSQLNQIAAAGQMLEGCATAAKDRTYLSVINQSVCRMLRIVGRMELEERLSGHPVRLSPSHVDLSPCMERLGRRLESILAAAGVRFSVSCPPTLLVYADGELLQQLLLELVTHLALAGTDISLTVTAQHKNVHFTVSDCGPGDAPGRPTLPNALERREENASLDFARRIAELLGGTLVISPGAGGSLSLAVSIPVTECPSCGRLESPHTAWSGGGFDPVLVALSELLPAAAFLPENLG